MRHGALPSHELRLDGGSDNGAKTPFHLCHVNGRAEEISVTIQAVTLGMMLSWTPGALLW